MLPTRTDAPDPRALIDCGDWACAHGNCEGLADVAGQLAIRACDADRGNFREVERLARIDMLAASSLWLQITAGRAL